MVSVLHCRVYGLFLGSPLNMSVTRGTAALKSYENRRVEAFQKIVWRPNWGKAATVTSAVLAKIPTRTALFERQGLLKHNAKKANKEEIQVRPQIVDSSYGFRY